MNLKKQCSSAWLLVLLFLGAAPLQAQTTTDTSPYFYFGLDLGIGRGSSSFLYEPSSPELLNHSETQYHARILGGYAFHPKHAVEVSSQFMPSAGGVRVSLQDYAVISNVHILNTLSLDLSYVYELFKIKRLRFRLGPTFGVALPLNPFDPSDTQRIGYQGSNSTETSFVEISASERANPFTYFGGRLMLEYGFGDKQRSLLFFNFSNMLTLTAVQRFDVRYQRIGSGIRSTHSTSFSGNMTFSLGFRYRLLK